DFDGDGNLDLAVANRDSGSVSVLLGNGDGTFQAAWNISAGCSVFVAVGHFHGEAILDIATPRSVLLNNGDGGFQAARNFAAGWGTNSVAVGDFNGDGVEDLAVANYLSSDVSVLLGNGDGTFQAAQNFGVGSFPRSVAVGDLMAMGHLTWP